MRQAARKDANHAEIKRVFVQMLGESVTDSSGWGDGAGDLFVSFGKRALFIEIKRDSKAKLKASQVDFHRRHNDVCRRCDTVEQAVDICAELRANKLTAAADKE